MYKKDEIEDSLEFCKQIQFYRDAEEKSERAVGRKSSVKTKEYYADRKYSLDALSDNEAVTRRYRKSDNFVIRFVNNIFMLGVCVLIAYFLASVVTHYVAHQTMVEGDSMEPSLSDGDSVIIQKLSYYFDEPKRFDVVVFPIEESDSKKTEDTYYVKRVIGLPNETVQIKGGKVYIDYKELKGDDYCLSEILNPGSVSEPVVLKENEYFVLGDNRNMSTDSRSDYVGMIKREDIIGEVMFCIWPVSHMGFIPK